MTTFSESISDVHLCKSDVARSYSSPGPLLLPNEQHEWARSLLESCLVAWGGNQNSEDFTVLDSGIWWRVRRDAAVVDGEWYRLRKMPEARITLSSLPGGAMPDAVREALLHKDICAGGLVLIMGAPGTGKTTTASATVASRLEKFGGLAYTVEDPPEHPLNGWHGKGYCAQTRVLGEGWAASLKGALRSQPAGMPSILFVGEIRDKETAAVALQAACSGFLVVATSFAQDIMSGLDGFTKQVGLHNMQVFSEVLRIVIYQNRLPNSDMIHFTILVSPDGNSQVGVSLRGGRLHNLNEQITYQSNMVVSGMDLFKVK